MKKPRTTRSENWWGIDPVVQPPSSVIVPEPDQRPVLYTPDGKPLIRRPIGFETARDERKG